MLKEFMNDPSCVGGPNTYHSIVTRNNLNIKFGNYIRVKKNLAFTIYFDAKKEVYLYHFRIISESDDKIIYDVVLEFTPTNESLSDESLLRYNMRFFSNSPGFGFNYAYVYKKYKLLIPLLEDKFGEELLTVPPKKSNPTQAVGFDYTIYYAMRFLALHDFYLSKREIALKGKKLESFDHQAILTFEEAFRERSTKDMGLVRKTMYDIGNDIRRTKNSVKKTVGGVIKPVTSFVSKIVPKKATKSSKSIVSKSKVIRPISKRKK